MTNSSRSKTDSLRALPSVDQLLRTEAAVELKSSFGLSRLTTIARQVTEELRNLVQSERLANQSKDALLSEAVGKLQSVCKLETTSVMRRVINATGVIIHTNLGRAPLSDAARKAVMEATGYCTLEYDQATGSRGKRGGHAEDLLTQLTGAEDALIVNNCASAALLILTVLARDGETVISRGELVEIGGDFRVPEVMSNSGTRMVEVGTTNRTRLEDYRSAITGDSRLIMKVHPSNYRIIGFTASPALSELSSLAHEFGMYLYEDAGSGALTDLSKFGLSEEPIIRESISAGADVVSFSGDKLVGATQAGLIVGRGEIIHRLRKHSLYRALRADKLCLAALEATLQTHRRGAIDELPVMRMLGFSADTINERAKALIGQLASVKIEARVVPGESAIGGGSGPNVHPQTALIALKHATLNADDLEHKLRHSSPPVITRIADGMVLVDLRTVAPNDEPDLLNVLTTVSKIDSLDNSSFK